MSQRHSRKRSSVSVKKRASQDIKASDQDTKTALGSPYPENNGSNWQSSGITTPEEVQSFLIMSPECDTGLQDSMPTTTRTEVDLFVDDDELLTEAPRIPTKVVDKSVSPSVKVLAHIPNGESARYNEAGKGSRAGSPSSSVGGNRDGLRQKPWLSNNSTRNGLSKGASSTSPSRGQFQSSPIRRMPQRGKRMSLNYISSPATPRLCEIDRNATLGFESATPSTAGTPGTSAPASSSNGYFGRYDVHGLSKMAVPMSATSTRSCSATSTSPTLSKMSKKEDGDTVMTQHRDLLEKIAEKERKIFELRENLLKEERELKKLQQTWQASVNKDIAIHQPSTSALGDDPSVSAGLLGSSADSELRRRELFQQPSVVAADGWKVLSATLAGAGTQINALIDQLATPVEADIKETNKNTRSGSTVIKEKEASASVVPLTPSNSVHHIKKAADIERVDKRTSMFGASMAALQKQVDAFSGIDGSIESTPKAAENNNTGWGTWQKRLKEARENASGLLAKAEQRLGQALVNENSAKVNPSKGQINKTNAADKSRKSDSAYDFNGENDREKAALAELTWLNSMAGVNMSGTTDRVTTSLPTAKDNKKSSPQQRTSRSGTIDTRRISNASQSSTSSKVKGIPSPPSLSNESDSTRKSGESSGLISLVSTVETVSIDEEDKNRDFPRGSGQSKTRNAALAAVLERGEEALKDSRLINIDVNKSPTQDVVNGLVKVVETTGEDDDDEAWGL